MKAGDPSSAPRCAARSANRVVLLDDEAARKWMAQSRSREGIRCAPDHWRSADEWIARMLASSATACRCEKWAAAQLEIDLLTPICAPLREQFAKRLLACANCQPAARLCIQLLGWGPPITLERLELWQAFAEFTPAASLPRIVVEGDALLDEADRIATAGVSIGVRVDPLEWERFLDGDDWSGAAARWRVAPVLQSELGSSDVGSLGILSEGTRKLVADLAPAALAQFKDPALGFGEAGQARSAAEALLFSVLDARPLTRGRFCLNARLDFQFGTRRAEGDLAARDARLVIEVDGYFHFRDTDAYRRDRRKDAALQEHGWFVLRFLAVDIVGDLEAVLAQIDSHLARLSL